MMQYDRTFNERIIDMAQIAIKIFCKSQSIFYCRITFSITYSSKVV